MTDLICPSCRRRYVYHSSLRHDLRLTCIDCGAVIYLGWALRSPEGATPDEGGGQ